jgi:hypothetical protein
MACVACLTVVASTIVQWRGPTALVDATAARELAPPDQPRAASRPFSPSTLPGAIADAAEATRWPRTLEPALDEVFLTTVAPAMRGRENCLHDPNAPIGSPRTCTWGAPDAEHTAVVLGDSIAMSWTPGVAAALVPHGWRVIALGFQACPVVGVASNRGPGTAEFAERCALGRAAQSELVDEVRPDVTIMSGAEEAFDRLNSGARGAAARSEWAHGTELTVARLLHSSRAVAVFGSPPTARSATTCATRVTGPGPCVAAISARNVEKRRAERTAVNALAQRGAAVRYVDTAPWLCTSTGRCPVEVGGTLARADAAHLTAAMSRRLARVIDADLQPLVNESR